MLVDKAYPDFQDNAKEQLALNHFIAQIENTQVAFSVKQKRPQNMDEVVSATLEMESYLTGAARTVGLVETNPSEEQDKIVGAITSTNDLVGQLLTRIERLEERVATPMTPGPPRLNSFGRRRPASDIVCWNCRRRGHIARVCRYPRAFSGNEQPPTRCQSSGGSIKKLTQKCITISTLPSSDCSETFYVMAEFGPTRIKVLIDTGSPVSLLSDKVWKAAGKPELRVWMEQNLIGINGSPLKVLGQMETDVSLSKVTCHTKFIIVENMSIEGILGIDFLTQNACNIDITNHSLYFS